MKFVVKGDQAPIDVTFRVEVDDDGDLMLYANGHKLLFITQSSGCVIRISMLRGIRAELAGFSFDKTGCIEIAG